MTPKAQATKARINKWDHMKLESFNEWQMLYEKMLNVTNHQGNANRNHTEMALYTSQDGRHTRVYTKIPKTVLERMWKK